MINSKKREDKTKNFKCYKIPIHITYPSFSFYFKYERKNGKEKSYIKKKDQSRSLVEKLCIDRILNKSNMSFPIEIFWQVIF